jgi:hypothetical protein
VSEYFDYSEGSPDWFIKMAKECHEKMMEIDMKNKNKKYSGDTSDTAILDDLVDMLRINRGADWDENDPQVEFEELLGYIKRQRTREASKAEGHFVLPLKGL